MVKLLKDVQESFTKFSKSLDNFLENKIDVNEKEMKNGFKEFVAKSSEFKESYEKERENKDETLPT